jgi:hypothetical protein
MLMRAVKVYFLMALSICLALEPLIAQTWTQTSAPTKGWMSLASSADGTKLIAGFEFGGLYTSTNSGVTWQTNTLLGPTHAAMSADGTRLVMSAGSRIYISTNGGAIWFSNVLGQDISAVAASADGMKLVAVNSSGNGGHIFTSTDGGATWATNTFAGKNWTSVASSADGTILIATANTGGAGAGIYSSTNSGLTWITNIVPVPAADWQCAAASADGTRLAAGIGGNGGAIFTSTNSGASWISNAVPKKIWASLACSADGTRLVAASGINVTIFTSTDSGTTWVSNSAPKIDWWAVASSADGDRLVAVANNNGIYIAQTAPSPVMSLNSASSNGNLALSWIVSSTNFVLQSSADLAGWTDLTNTPVLNLTNLQNQIFLPPPESNVFFRLKTP